MLKTALIMLTAGLLLLALSGCDPDTTPIKLISSMFMDGRQFEQNDNDLMLSIWGRAFYVSDDLIFHLGEKLWKRSLHSTSAIQLIPDNLTVTDTRYLVIDQQQQLLYFAADHAIYKVGFGGEALTLLSPTGKGSYSAPALSSYGNYLTAIKDQRIARMNIQTGVWIELPSPVTAEYAVFDSDTNEYYYFSVLIESYHKWTSLNKLSAARQDSTLLMIANYDDDHDAWLTLQASPDQRYFAMLSSKEPKLIYGYFTPDYWERYSETLWVHDSQTGTNFSVPGCYSYAFAPDTGELVYSRSKYGMADLMRHDLESGVSTLIWDGYYSPSFYSFSVSEIFVRNDGQKLFIEGWKKALRTESKGKSIAGEMTGPRDKDSAMRMQSVR